MPKPSQGKKRKAEKSKKGIVKPSKKSKCNETPKTHDESNAKQADDHLDGGDQEDTCPVKDCDIDEELDRNASKNKLSVFNVKSIIHHVLSDERVIAMAQKAAESEKTIIEDDDEAGESEVVFPEVEPKLTRSRFREVAQSTGTADPLVLVKETIIHSPLKKVVSPLKSKLKSPDKAELLSDFEQNIPKVPLAEINFSEGGSSDEEYDPLKEEWEGSETEDSESCVSNTSDLASPEPLRRTSRVKRCLMPDQVTSPQPVKRTKGDQNAQSGQEEAIISPFKVPLPVQSKKSQGQRGNKKEGLIASRTRSRLPLTDTSLETLETEFVPPDFSPDLYDLINLDELDSEDLYWHKWLSGLTTEKGVTPDTEDTEDTEYNFMAEDQKEELEEYRTDRAVKVSQRELADLFEEFLSEFGDEIAEPEENTPQPETQCSTVSMSQEEPDMTFEQKRCLIKQLQQHTQLLVQVHLLAKEHPSLQNEAMACRTFLNELLELDESASNASVCRLLENQNTPPSVFSYVGLSEAARIISLPPLPLISSVVTTPPVASKTRKPRASVPKSSDGVSDNLEKGPPIPQETIDILASSPIFVYTALLPNVGFGPQETRSKSVKFLQAEDNLLVLGIDQFGSNWQLIQKHYLPAKTAKQIQIRRKNLCSTRAPDNVVKQFKKTGKIPHLPVPVTFKDNRNRILLPNKEIVSETKDSGQPKKSGRKKKKVTRDAPTASKEIFPVQEIKPEMEKNVIIKVKETSDDTKNRYSLEMPCVTYQRTNEIVVETLYPQPSRNDLRTTPIGFRDDQGAPDKSVALEEIGSQSLNDKELFIHSPSFLRLPISSPTAEHTVSNQNAEKNGFARGNFDKENFDSEIFEKRAVEIENFEKRNDENEKFQTEIFEKENFENEDFEKEQPPNQLSDGSKDTAAISQTETLEDAKIRDRAIAFAQSYLNNVKKCLEDDSSTYQAFLEVLLKSKSENWSPTKLYKEVGDVLQRFPELVRDFVGFLEPHQACEAGVFMTNNEIFRARTFLKRVENHFQKNPSHFQKIIKAFTSYNLKEPRPTELYDMVVPLLRGQQYLIEDFNSFFIHLKPQPSNSEDFEEVELGSGSDVEVDDFEEVIIPDLTSSRNPRKPATKGKCPPKGSSKSPGNRKPPHCSGTRKVNKVKKRDICGKTDVEESSNKCDKTNECGNSNGNTTRGTGTEETNANVEDMKGTGELSGSGIVDYDKKVLDSDGESSGYKMSRDDENEDGSTGFSHGDPVSPMKKSGSEHSNESSPVSECKSVTVEDFLDNNAESPETTQGSHMTSTSEGTSDLSNEACDIHARVQRFDYGEMTKRSDYAEDDDAGMEEDETIIEKQRSLRDEEEGCNQGQKDGIQEDITDQVNVKQEGMEESCVKKEPFVYEEQEETDDQCGRISANNLELDKDGKSVIVWTREDDKKILQIYQNRGSSENVYSEIAEELGNRTAAQVEGRFRILVSLLADSNNADGSSDDSDIDTDDESYEELDDKE